MNIIQRVKKLELPADQLIVIGSGIMDALGIRQSHDIDLVVTLELFNELKDQGWHQEVMHGEERLLSGDVEAWKSWGSLGGKPNFQELLESSVIIEGLRFSSLEYVLNWKRQHGGDNPKHMNDIRLIEEYLKNAE